MEYKTFCTRTDTLLVMDARKLWTDCLEEKEVACIRASQVAQVTKSPFVLWADAHAPASKQDPPNAFQEMLFARGDAHEQEVLSSEYPDAQEMDYADAQEGFFAVLEQLFSGVDSLAQAPLFFLPRGLRGRPDLLVRVEGESVFGEYMYVVKEIKYAKNLKDYHRLQAAYYTYLLGLVQGVTPEYFVLVNREHEEFVYAYADYEQELLEAISRAREVLSSQDPPLPVYGEEWPWEVYSKELAQEFDDVSQLYRLGRSVRSRLHEAGIYTLADLRAATKEEVLAVKGVGAGTYRKWSKQLEAFAQQAPVQVASFSLASASRVLFFDIEGDTELGVDYLYGLLEGEEFTYFWADAPEEEEVLWKDFLSFIDSLEDAVICYYTSYERQSLARMKRLYGCPDALWEKLQGMLVDLFPVLRKSFAFPLASYSIKPVAQYLGCSWRAEDAGGAKSMEWYARYWAGEASLKQKSQRDNEEDVRATKVLSSWLAKHSKT